MQFLTVFTAVAEEPIQIEDFCNDSQSSEQCIENFRSLPKLKKISGPKEPEPIPIRIIPYQNPRGYMIKRESRSRQRLKHR